jgi:hypothetical protein
LSSTTGCNALREWSSSSCTSSTSSSSSTAAAIYGSFGSVLNHPLLLPLSSTPCRQRRSLFPDYFVYSGKQAASTPSNRSFFCTCDCRGGHLCCVPSSPMHSTGLAILAHASPWRP